MSASIALESSTMSPNRFAIPVEAFREAEKRLQKIRWAQRSQQFWSAFGPKKGEVELGNSGEGKSFDHHRVGGDDDGGRDATKNKASLHQPLKKIKRPQDFKNISGVSTLMKSESTYCLTGSELFWTIDEEIASTGSWRP